MKTYRITVITLEDEVIEGTRVEKVRIFISRNSFQDVIDKASVWLKVQKEEI